MGSPRSLFLLIASLTAKQTSSVKHAMFAYNITSQRVARKLLHTSTISYTDKEKEKNEKSKKTKTKALTTPFDFQKRREKETFLEVLRKYQQRPGPKSDCVAFIRLALKYMDEFGVNKDLEVYKKLLDIFPKGTHVPKNPLQVIFFYYFKEQSCAIDVLTQMENNGVCPDAETEMILINVFGKWGLPVMKCHRLTYWFPKFKNASPWIVPKPLPNDTMELAKHIISRITSVDLQSVITVYNTENVESAIEKTWIVSAISPTQATLLKRHNKHEPLFVEGPFLTWLGDKNIEYFILRAKPPKEGYVLPDNDFDDVSHIRIPHIEPDLSYIIPYPSVHEQKDGIIMSVCATGTSSKDSLLSWIRCLEKEHPVLEKIPVVFTLKKPVGEATYIDESEETKRIEESR